MTTNFRNFLCNEDGATAIEYALVASLVPIAIISALSNLGTKLQRTFNEVASNLK